MQILRAVSSIVEYCIDIAGVVERKTRPTNQLNILAA